MVKIVNQTFPTKTIVLLLLLGLGGCSSLPREEPVGTHSPAADTLLAQANSKAANGEIPQAIATLERAVRLQPRNGHAWLRLAELYLAQGEYHKAEQFAGRAQQFSTGDTSMLRRINAVIRQAQEQQQERG